MDGWKLNFLLGVPAYFQWLCLAGRHRGIKRFDSLHLQHVGFVVMDLIIAVDCVSWMFFAACFFLKMICLILGYIYINI